MNSFRGIVIKGQTLLIFVSLMLVLVLMLPHYVCGDTHTVGPTDCSAAAVNVAISAASDGDTVLLTCAGTVPWTAAVTIPNTKGITLQVQNGTNGSWDVGRTAKTGTNFPLAITSNRDPIITVNIENNNSVARITGFSFTNTIASTKGAVLVQGRGTGKNGKGAFRIDNNYFHDIQLPRADLHGTITSNSSTGVMTGLIDNNTFHDCSYTDGYTIAITEQWKYGGSSWDWAGNNAWTRALAWGTSDFIFIEDNLIENISRYTRHLIMGIEGAKYVIRYNTFNTNKDNGGTQTEQIDAHGLCFCTSIGAGTRGGEIYSNILTGSEVGSTLMLRGGTWLVYDNTIAAVMSLKEYRAYSSCDQCDTTCASDPDWIRCVSDGTYYPLSQQITGSYFWNNLSGGVNQSPSVDSRGVQRTYLQANRDYFVSASKPAALASYSPYTYPHPLRGNDGGPAAPKDLRITP